MTAAIQHLNDETFALLLDRQLSASKAQNDTLQGAERHLDHCAACRTELNALAAGLCNLRLGLTGLAEELPQGRLHRQTPRPARSRGLGLVPAVSLLSMAAAGILVAAVHPFHTATPSRTAAARVVVAAESPTLSDSALLESIDQDLATSVPPSLAPLVPTTTTSTTSIRK